MNTCALNLLGTAHKLIESEIYRTRHFFLFVCVCVCGCCSGLQTAAAAADLAANRTQLLLLLIVLVLLQTGLSPESDLQKKEKGYLLADSLFGGKMVR